MLFGYRSTRDNDSNIWMYKYQMIGLGVEMKGGRTPLWYNLG